MGTEKLKTEVRREQIVRAALELVAERGGVVFSVVDLARRIGLVPAAIYRHFESKDEVIDAILDHIRKRLIQNVARARSRGQSALEAMHLLLKGQVQLILGNSGIPTMMFSLDAVGGNSSRKKRINEVVGAFIAQVEEIVRHSQAEGDIRPELDSTVVTMMFVGLIQPVMFLRHLGSLQFDLESHVEQSWELFQRAVSK